MGAKRKLQKRSSTVPNRNATATSNKVRDTGKSSLDNADSSQPTSWYLFPSYTIHVIAFVIFVGRLNIIANKRNWWILHPNEVFHSLEVAHSEMYGYGFRVSDYLPIVQAPDPAHEFLYSIRSWIYPKFFIACLKIKHIFSIPISPFQFMKNIHALIASSLPITVFLLLRNLQRRHYWSDLAVLAAILVALNDYCILIETHTFDSGFLAPFSFLSYVLFTTNEREDDIDRISKPKVDKNCNTLLNANQTMSLEEDATRTFTICNFGYLLSGILVGLCCYIRPDTVIEISLVHLFILSYFWQSADNVWKRYLLAFTGLTCGFLLGGFDDFKSYGLWFLSLKRWIHFHWFHAPSVYEQKPIDFYLNAVFSSFSTIAFLLFAFLDVILYVANTISHLFSSNQTFHHWFADSKTLTIRFFLVSLALFLTYGLHPYKELHFFHAAVVMILCSGANAICNTYHLLRVSLIEEGLSRFVPSLKLLLYAEVLMLTIQSFSVNSPTNIKTSAEVNACMDYVGRQKDVTGLLIDYPVHWTGGFALLHKDVPLIAKIHYDFREWDKGHRLKMSSTFGNQDKISLALTDQVSNYIVEDNGPLVFQLVAKNKDYNYVILTKNRKFPKKGFREVVRFGNTTVAKRIRSKTAEEDLRNIAASVDKQKRNASVYEFEAGWLLRLQLPELAVERLETAISIDRECVGCWQLLNIANKMLLGVQETQSIHERCYSAVGKEKCNTITKTPNLYPRFYFGLTSVQPVPFEKL